MKQAIAVYHILLKDMRSYYLKPPNISWGIIFPFAWMLMMFVKTDQAIEISEIFPGIVALSVLFGTTSMLAVTITFERKSRSFDRLLLAPVRKELLVLAKISGAVLFGIFNSMVPVLFCVLYFRADISSWLILGAAIFLLSVVSTLLGLLIAVSAKEVFEAQTYSNFFRFPMIFLCGLFIPLTALPLFLMPLSLALPVTYGVDMLHFAISGMSFLSPVLDMGILLTFCFLLFFVCMINIRRKWMM